MASRYRFIDLMDDRKSLLVRIFFRIEIIMAVIFMTSSILYLLLGKPIDGVADMVFITSFGMLIILLLLNYLLTLNNRYRFVLLLAVICIEIAALLFTIFAQQITILIIMHIIIITGIITIAISSVVSFFYILLVNTLHNIFVIVQINEGADSLAPSEILFNILVSVLMLGFWYIMHLGYREIQKFYIEALIAQRELEYVNKILEQRVESRTSSLVEEYQQQMNSLHALATLGGIARSIFHDLAAPVSALLAISRQLKREDTVDTEILSIYDNATEQMNKILQDARLMMKGNADVQTVHIKEIIERVVSIISSELYRYSIDIKIKIRSDFIVHGVVSMLERVIMNLLVNAIEELSILKDNEDKRITITCFTADQENTIIIEDSGRGIPEALFEKIFSADFSTKHENDNLGVGLSFVRRAIEQNFEGYIELESNTQLGKSFTRFVISLPAQD